jgi:hypothetical protein
MVLKLYFEKAYDKIKWPFLQQALRIKGFSPMWCEWIQKVMSKGSVAMKVNDVVGRYFQTCKGVCQGDPFLLILFNLAVDVFVKLIERAQVNGQIKGIIPHLVDDGLSILQYVDDMNVLLDQDLEQAKNLKIMLSAFEQLSGLKINFHKSEMFCYGKAKDWHFEYS